MDITHSCVFIAAGPSTKLFAWGVGGFWRTCATRDDEPSPLWTSLPIITHCVCVLLLQDLVPMGPVRNPVL